MQTGELAGFIDLLSWRRDPIPGRSRADNLTGQAQSPNPDFRCVVHVLWLGTNVRKATEFLVYATAINSSRREQR
jgi:hypothetical protein